MNTGSQIGNETDTLVFWLFTGLRYQRRMLVAFALIAAGLLLQWYSGPPGYPAGALVMLLGNLLLLVKGYDNRVEFGSYHPSSQWQQVERSRLSELKQLDQQMRRWDRSWIDITNARGQFSFGLIALALAGLWIVLEQSPYRILPVDAAVLLLPHWFTGTRRILRLPGLLIKADLLERVLRDVRPEREGDEVEVMMLLKGDEHPLPDDIKIKLRPSGAKEAFLGLYGQVVINAVQGKSYPYFYVVLVARPGLGLDQLAREFQPPDGLVAEYKTQNGVQILVLRQHTTKTSGYHTEPERVVELLTLGRHLAKRLIAVAA